MRKLNNVSQRYQYIGFLSKSIRIKENGFWGMNDFDGNTILPSNYIEVFTLSSGYGLIAARDAGSWGIYDYFGNKLNSERIDSLYSYYGLFGMTKIKIGSKWGVINKYGKIIVPVKYIKIERFGKGIVLHKSSSTIDFLERSELIKLTKVNKIPNVSKVKKSLSKKIINLPRKKEKQYKN